MNLKHRKRSRRKAYRNILFVIANFFIINFGQAQQVKMNIGLIYPISSNGSKAPKDTNDLSINLLAGISAVENGASLAGLTNIVLLESHGAQFAGFSNHIGKKSTGTLFAGFMNTYGCLTGSSFAGFGNFAKKDVKGVQFAGFSNVTGGTIYGQFAGFANMAKNINGSQFAGFINVAQNVVGSQFGGFINVAKNVKGAQIAGFINVAKNSDSPIGLINIIKNGEIGIGLSYDENRTAMLSFKSGGKNLYGIIGAGYNFKNQEEIYAFEAGLGAHFFSSNNFRLNIEATEQVLQNFERGEYFKTTLKALPALKIGDHIELFAGPSLNLVSTNTEEGKALHQKNLHTWQQSWSAYKQVLYLGYTAGLQIIL